MELKDKFVTSFNLSREAFVKLDRIAYTIDKSRSNTLNHILLNLSDYTLTKYGKKPTKGEDATNEKNDC